MEKKMYYIEISHVVRECYNIVASCDEEATGIAVNRSANNDYDDVKESNYDVNIITVGDVVEY
jgi:hypothetical protein